MSLSMTGYGQAILHYEGYKVRLELKSVNHRYCEVMMRIPREWTRYEDGLRRTVQQQIKRGRIDVFIHRERDEEQMPAARLNDTVVQAYLHAAEQLADRYGVKGTLGISDILTLPDVLGEPGEACHGDEEDWEEQLQRALNEALQGLLEMRRREGGHLAQDVESRILRLESLHHEMTVLAPHVVSDYRNRLKHRLKELQDGSFTLDEHKFGMEIALFADRSNIDEELTRLQSHFGQCKGLLLSDEPAGRKLDFLIQEMNREVNTIGSKANHLTLVNLVVEMKAELEKIREQAANIE
ncbi:MULTISPECIES: YicC/YloC family endoribonuclease [Paenibacillus]|uniref:YicC/YloC family endoribonuclease n=1 Tax=Paenibacillus TaxID=44249 RepID=UPI00048E7A99|nr:MULTISPECIES: YicC/YloC family endoribonuclease [Paenibacillus]ALA42905.1 stress-induced protein [Paenibacillus peoriae]APB75300.1 YicC family protein [Paenibacillus polymyxa]OMF79528.1 YicC family protein [Paenibacillus peoriae]POR27798.1 YicC family protein [Paenibacillus polymyxa]SFR07577.1 TIGR00255 family protein [Paenibacillus sp. cl130]